MGAFLVSGIVLSSGPCSVEGSCEANRGECVDLFKEKPSGILLTGDIFSHGCTDLVIYVDCSDSMTAEKYNEAIAFVLKLIQLFKFGPNDSRLAFIVASDKQVTTLINFEQSTTQSKAWMTAQIAGLQMCGGTKNTLGGLLAIQQASESFPRPHLGDKNRASLILTHGKEKEAAPVGAQAFDLAIVIDVTGSMGGAINALTTQLAGMIQQMQKYYPQLDMRCAISAYRDFGDAVQYETFDFSGDEQAIMAFLGTLKATGGGDYREDFLGGINNAIAFSWRQDSTKMVVAITDAPGNGDITQGKDKDDIFNALFQLKCKIGFHQCGPTSLIPAADYFWLWCRFTPVNDIIPDILTRATNTIDEVAWAKVAKVLCALGVDLVAVGLGPNSDYLKLYSILRYSIRKQWGTTSPVIMRSGGLTLDALVTLASNKIKEGSDICSCNRCLNKGLCRANADSSFACVCRNGYDGKNCEEPQCLKCKAQAFGDSLLDPKVWVPQCEQDGRFKAVQYHKAVDQSFCVGPDGKEIEGTRVSGSQIDCSKHQVPAIVNPCEKRRQEFIASGNPFKPVCDTEGYYKSSQCFKGMCWCTMKNGQHIPATFHALNSKDTHNYCLAHHAIKPWVSCAAAPSHGFLRHPLSCNRYIRCAPERVFTCVCPSGLSFNSQSLECDDSSYAQCMTDLEKF